MNFNKDKNFPNFISSYFNTAVEITKNSIDNILTFQFFQRNDNVVFCGSNIALNILNKEIPHKFEAWSLEEGSIINNLEVAFILKGKASDILKFEGILDGIFSRLSKIATNARNIINISNKPIIMMADRNDIYFNQELDGYAAYIGGIRKFCSNAQTNLIHNNNNDEPFGSIPHSLIVNFNGDLKATLLAYKKIFPSHKIISLVDFNNDVINDSLLSAKILGQSLYAVRVDTSSNLIDKSLNNIDINIDKKYLYGVNPTLIKLLRKKLDENNFHYVKIIVSSGFNTEKIKFFIQEKTPIDLYGVGNYLMNSHIQFTGDAVQVNGKNLSKFGRSYLNNLKLMKIS